ncbi:MAG: low molecular weight protein arginine phosphatase [Bacillota bacterium]|nr:low molecular weight protein arginine phosphatase [Bacillota bacterium]
MKILFLCTGNTCRSRMAEAIFNKLNDAKDIKAYSAGIMAVSGTKTSKNAAIVIKENLDIDISSEPARMLSSEMVKEADLILSMTDFIEKSVKNSYPLYIEKIFTLNGYIGLNSNILDPFGGDLQVYRQTFNQLYNSILLLNNKLKEDNGIY